MKYRKKTRLKVYKEVLSILYRRHNICKGGLCYILKNIDIKYNIIDFPELMEHCPKKYKTDPSLNHWFNIYNKYGYYKRINILKQAINELK